MNKASVIATSKVAYPETRAALARGLREEKLALVAYKEAVMNFIADWTSCYILELTDAVIYVEENDIIVAIGENKSLQKLEWV